MTDQKEYLQASSLGKETRFPEFYDNSVLFRIPRNDNRIKYGIDTKQLPFVGVDVWNAYEVSFLTDNGLPVTRVMKMRYAANSDYIVESKSLKLYLHSFNMEFSGENEEIASEQVRQTIIRDLSALLETSVEVTFFTVDDEKLVPFDDIQNKNITKLVDPKFLQRLTFDHYRESPELLHGVPADREFLYKFHADLLRSNCPVTNQPDWGDLFVSMKTAYEIEFGSIIQYLVSFRKENHFHEEVVEMIFKRFSDAFNPSSLMVAAMYTRRGGIDINPVRATRFSLIDEAFLDMKKRLGKMLRQ